MGKIRTKEIKNAALELIERYPGKWKKTFEENKKIANELNLFTEKKARNKVIGYLTRKLARSKK
ncbi:MAG: 30S ribosomal protein S17e [Candidatus Aenigmatarchaeota archaeon]|nr:MAG: 30S ribosomal protein S17e [Candidatus Aenigmarchaeota archaeon ex4484_14]RLI97480.1 MAG: 30S ribosomal protein S17e [Candidatus Aenigmarchaeota archaeon]